MAKNSAFVVDLSDAQWHSPAALGRRLRPERKAELKPGNRTETRQRHVWSHQTHIYLVA